MIKKNICVEGPIDFYEGDIFKIGSRYFQCVSTGNGCRDCDFNEKSYEGIGCGNIDCANMNVQAHKINDLNIIIEHIGDGKEIIEYYDEMEEEKEVTKDRIIELFNDFGIFVKADEVVDEVERLLALVQTFENELKEWRS